ncbi:PhzF family phenazine biosynthesis protein [Wenzhouxiangella sp. AB-CW3]|uniref:PhzF family phenazine biosynthesis protein n=1 Tax=Wenzhouxiangella sp. AB-CW3 TaxID=2771012 RepID=UPI00168AD0AE|nr:PhzF family phenazine biosynthesis protein [Wenzhouxiangella sp. AB-CW3]QOC21406.1 PhzF family phenazine biosynthesis protein [Wenzhouxiangella sp. AB-CW3]
MPLQIFQIDAFAERVFEGNPAAVVPLDDWLDDDVLQAIAMENNLSETAFFVPAGDRVELRWFTPRAEVDLCGHATLATAHVLFKHLGHDGDELRFDTRSGELRVRRCDDGLAMDFPALPAEPVDVLPALAEALRCRPQQLLAAPDYLAVFESEEQVRMLEPDFAALKRLDRRGVIATAPGREWDFVSRCFYPKLDVNEDPVTGSAHCKSAPYWGQRLGRKELVARQLSARGGTVRCRLVDDRVILVGQAVDYMRGEIWVDGLEVRGKR